MRIDLKNLGDSLARHGFSPGRHSRIERSYAYTRPSPQAAQLFELVIVRAQGRHADAVYGEVGVGVTCIIDAARLVRSCLLDELASDVERGWTIVTSRTQALAWQDRFTAIAPARATEYAAEEGPRLLRETQAVRSGAKRCIERIQPLRPVQELLCRLRDSLSAGVVEEAERLAAWPGVLQVFGAEDLYLAACMAVLNGEIELGPARPVLGRDPLDDLSLLQKIQLVADHLLTASEPGICGVRADRSDRGGG